MRTQTVAAVVVTFNRKQMLTECLDSLLNQTRSVDKILVIDNASSDGTFEILTERMYLERDSIIYTRLAQNVGGAGGFHEGMKQAFDLGYDWLWVMDDDAEPALNALEILAEEFNSKGIAAIAGLAVDSGGEACFSHRGWFEFEPLSWHAIKPIERHDISAKMTIEFASFVGLCISRDVVAKVGLPRKEFFIHHDDLEFCSRISDFGNIILKTESTITHKEQSKGNRNTDAVFGRSSLRDDYDKLWLRYFGLRNYIWITRKTHKNLTILRLVLPFLTRKILGILVYDDHKFRRIQFYISAVLDGWFGHFDNASPKIILYGRQKGFGRTSCTSIP